jgi:hypothetical protein
MFNVDLQPNNTSLPASNVCALTEINHDIYRIAAYAWTERRDEFFFFNI